MTINIEADSVESNNKPTIDQQTQTLEFIAVDIYEDNDITISEIDKINSTSKLSDIKLREQQLQQKEQEIRRLEAALNAEFININAGETTIISNSPQHIPLKESLKNTLKPLPIISTLYREEGITSDKEEDNLLLKANITYKLTILGLILNVTTIGIAGFYDDYYNTISDKSHALFTSIIWLILGIPFGYMTWYKHLNNLVLNHKLSSWYMYNFSFIIHLLFSCIMLTGIPWYPCGGVFFCITTFFGRLHISFILSFINTVIWTGIFAYSTYIYNSAKILFTNKLDSDIETNNINKLASIALKFRNTV